MKLNTGSRWTKVSFKFWLLVLFLALVFLTGGSARSDVQSLPFLRPAAIVMVGIALCTLKYDKIAEHKFLLSIAASIFALVSLQLLIPLDAFGPSLPQGAMVGEIARKAQIDLGGLPFTLSPLGTSNAFFALFVPLAVMLFAIQLDQNEHRLLLLVLLAFGLASGLIGLLQAAGNPNGGLYLYRITNNGFAVGLFSNRNHQAVMLATLFPMLAIYAVAGGGSPEVAKFRRIAAAIVGTSLLPLLLVTGSRAGLLAALAGIVIAFLIYLRATRRSGKSSRLAVFLIYGTGAVIISLVVAFTSGMTRAVALQRLLAGDASSDLRFGWWPTIAKAATEFAPWGAGLGSFAEIFRGIEPVTLLRPQYVNMAHNDWLETYLTAGWGGLAIAILTLAVLCYRFLQNTVGNGTYSPKRGLAIAGAFCVASFALASIFDYPLRTPLNASIFAIAMVWILAGTDSPKRQSAEEGR